MRDGVNMPTNAWKLSLHGLYTVAPPTETRAIDVPTLILCGGQDGLLPRADQDSLAARIEGSELKFYPDASHLVLWECPDQVAADTTAFLASLD